MVYALNDDVYIVNGKAKSCIYDFNYRNWLFNKIQINSNKIIKKHKKYQKNYCLKKAKMI